MKTSPLLPVARAAFLGLLLLVWLQAAVPAARATLIHVYQFKNGFADDLGGPALVPGGQGGAGALNTDGYAFLANQGLSVSGALPDGANYSLLLDVSLTDLTGYRKLIDFSNLVSDNGFYNLNTSLNFYPVSSGPTGVLQPNVILRIVLTRDGATGRVEGFVNGVQQFSIDDSVTRRAVFTTANGIIQFLNDDSATGFREASGGTVRQIAIYDAPVTAAEATALGLPVGSVGPLPGAVLPGFNPGTSADATVRAIVFQPDGKSIIGGAFSNYRGVPRNGIARVNADGTLDASFNPGSGADDTVNALLLADNGQVIVGGDFVSINGVPRNGLARLNADGSVDASFDAGLVSGARAASTGAAFISRVSSDRTGRMAKAAGVNSPGFVSSIQFAPNGQIIVGGGFQQLASVLAQGIARLNPNGVPDTTFKSSAGPNGKVNATVVQPDGKTLIAGEFTEINGVSRNGIARLKANGKVDPDFDPGAGAQGGSVKTIALQADGAVVLGGNFTSVNDQPRPRVARVKANGSVDNGFNPGSGADGEVRTVALESNGKILLGGSFQKVADSVLGALARLNSNGSLDQSFSPGSGANAPVNAIALKGSDSSSVLVGGDFTAVGNTSRTRLALVNAGEVNTGLPTVSISADPTEISRAAGQTARITFTRTGGDLSQEIKVAYQIGGSAVGGSDYAALKGVKKLKAGKASASLQIAPLEGGGTGKVTLKLLPGDGYTPEDATKVKVKITE
jgi:uncharacterized delta-60 repeat protein